MDLFWNVVENWAEYLGYAMAAAGGLLSIALVIPGEQPDKFLQSVVDFLTKLSKK